MKVTYTIKDFCRELQWADHTFRRWMKRLDARPDVLEHNSCYRWSEAGRAKFFEKYRDWVKRNPSYSGAKKLSGIVGSLTLPLNGKAPYKTVSASQTLFPIIKARRDAPGRRQRRRKVVVAE